MFYITFTLLWYTLAMQPRPCIDIPATATDTDGLRCDTGRAKADTWKRWLTYHRLLIFDICNQRGGRCVRLHRTTFTSGHG